MKKLLILFLLLSLCCSSCNKEETPPAHDEGTGGNTNTPAAVERDPYTRYQTDNLAPGHYPLLHGETVVFPYNNVLYAAGEEGLGRYSLPELTYEAICTVESAPDMLYIEDDTIFLMAGTTIQAVTLTGEHVGTYSLDVTEDMRINDPCMTLIDRTLWVTGGVWKDNTAGSYMFRISLETGESVCLEMESAGGEEWVFQSVYSISPESAGDKDILVMVALCAPPMGKLGDITSGIVLYDVKKNTYEMETAFTEVLQNGEYFPDDGVTYGINDMASSYSIYAVNGGDDAPAAFMYIDNEKRSEALTELSSGEERINPYIADVFFTGADVLAWNNKVSVLSVYDLPSGEVSHTLTLIYSKIPQDQVMNANIYGGGPFLESTVQQHAQKFSMEQNCTVNSIAYDTNLFEDRLRMKLLAGETDFDIVYLSDTNEGQLFASVLRYGLYLPLEGYTEITDNFSEYIPGAREAVTYDGHLYGIPFTYKWTPFYFSAEWTEYGLPEISSEMSYEEFWAVCETAAEVLPDDVGLAFKPYTWLLMPAIQEGLDNGQLDEVMLRNILENIQKYTNKGLFTTTYKGKSSYLIQQITYPAGVNGAVSMVNFHPDATVASIGSTGGYAEMQKFIFANAKTKNPELAVKYLEFLSEPEQLYRESSDLALLGKNVGAYYTMTWQDKMWGDTVSGEWYTWNKESVKLDEYSALLLESTQELSPNIQPYTIETGVVEEIITEVVENGLLTGKLTVEEAAENLYSELCYRFLE